MLGTPNVGKIFLFVFCMFLQDFGVQTKENGCPNERLNFANIKLDLKLFILEFV